MDKPRFAKDQMRGNIADFQGSMNVVPAGKTPEGILAQALEANLRVSVEGYELDISI